MVCYMEYLLTVTVNQRRLLNPRQPRPLTRGKELLRVAPAQMKMLRRQRQLQVLLCCKPFANLLKSRALLWLGGGFQLDYTLECGWWKTAILPKMAPNIICGSPMTKNANLFASNASNSHLGVCDKLAVKRHLIST